VWVSRTRKQVEGSSRKKKKRNSKRVRPKQGESRNTPLREGRHWFFNEWGLKGKKGLKRCQQKIRIAPRFCVVLGRALGLFARKPWQQAKYLTIGQKKEKNGDNGEGGWCTGVMEKT